MLGSNFEDQSSQFQKNTSRSISVEKRNHVIEVKLFLLYLIQSTDVQVRIFCSCSFSNISLLVLACYHHITRLLYGRLVPNTSDLFVTSQSWGISDTAHFTAQWTKSPTNPREEFKMRKMTF